MRYTLDWKPGMLFPGVLRQATPVMLSLAFLLAAPVVVYGQVCNADGVEINFRLRGNENSITLKEAMARELVGTNSGDFAVGMRAGSTYARGDIGAIDVYGLDVGNFPDQGLSSNSFERKRNNVWEINFPRGLYEFRRKSDLELEIILEVTGGQASHISGGSSAVTLDVDEGKIHEVWWGGTNSIRTLFGNLDFRFSDFEALATAGLHRATLNMCVNVKGHL